MNNKLMNMCPKCGERLISICDEIPDYEEEQIDEYYN